MAQNAWIQFNASLRREGHFKDDKNDDKKDDKNDDTKPKLTFGQWLQKEWESFPEIPYPTDTDYDELIISMNT
tara:strand:- start:778 stop:996 length:219 start_codon:yes stop_codon:yes gene_type:complete